MGNKHSSGSTSSNNQSKRHRRNEGLDKVLDEASVAVPAPAPGTPPATTPTSVRTVDSLPSFSQKQSTRRDSQRGSQRPSSSSQRPCPYFMSGYCRSGPSCAMAHDESGQHETATPTHRSPNKQPKVRSEEQALLLAMLNSLKDSLKSAQSPAERAAIYSEMRKTADEFKVEHDRIRRHRADSRASAPAGASPTTTPPRAKASPLKNVQFPTFRYESERFAGSQRESEESSEDRIECSICINSYAEGEDILVLPCLHWFHASCAHQWLEKSTQCPLCQHDILTSL